MKNLLNSILSNLYWIILLIISIILSIVICCLNQENILKPGLDIIQHLLTVASIVLGIITLNLTILISIRDGIVYQKIKETKEKIIKQLYGYAIASIVSSAIVIGLSLLILSTKQIMYDNSNYKHICIVLLSASFINMIFDTSMSFIQNVQLLKLDDTSS